MNEKLTDAKQLLAACGWSLREGVEHSKMVYVVVDQWGVPRRSFVPIERLYDYARGVFDAQRFE
jgi:nitrogen fixation protein FixH